MKTAFSNLPCMQLGGTELIELCRKYNIDGVEIRANNDGSFVYDKNLNITDIGTGICISDYSSKQIETAKELLSKDIPAIRVFLGHFRKRYTDPKKEISYDGIVRELQDMCDLCDKGIWVETHNEFATGKVLKKLISDVNRKNLKIIWDIVHPIEDGESPYETWNSIGDSIAHVHIKDGKKNEDPDWHDYFYTPLGSGELPIAEIIDILKKNNFEGYLSLEWESPWRNELKSLNFSIDEILQKYVDFMEGLI